MNEIDRYNFHGDEREIQQNLREIKELKDLETEDDFDNFLFYGEC